VTTEKGCWCGLIACVCAVAARHRPSCRFRVSILCPVGIECEHGYDVCPKCDPCTCDATDCPYNPKP
jgi:hypothetical protein